MARKKGAAPAADAAAPAVSLDETIKKLIERGKKRGSLTYEEINAVFDNIDDDHVPSGLTICLKRSLASMGIEIVEEQAKEEKA